MRRILALLVLITVAVPILAQRPARRVVPPSQAVFNAEIAVKSAIERIGNDRKAIEVMLQVHAHIRSSDRALVDPMQPSIAVQKAFEEMSEAERKNTDFFLRQGLIKARHALDAARKSPGTADFGRLRAMIREEALDPSSRLVVRAATALHAETVAWLGVQELIASHLKSLADITGEGLRAAQEE